MNTPSSPLDYPGRTPLVDDPAAPNGQRAMTGDEAIAAVRTYFDLFTELRLLLRDHDLDNGGAAAYTRMVRDDPMDHDPWAQPMLAIAVADVERILDRAPKLTLSGGKSASPLIQAAVDAVRDGSAMLFLGDPKDPAMRRALDDLFAARHRPALDPDVPVVGDTFPAWIERELRTHHDGITLDRLCSELDEVCLAAGQPSYSSYDIISGLGTLVAHGRVSIYAPEEGGAPVYQAGSLTLPPEGIRLLTPLAVALAEHLDVRRPGSTLEEMARWVADRFTLAERLAGPNQVHLTIALAWLAQKNLATHPAPGRGQPYFAPRHAPAGTPS